MGKVLFYNQLWAISSVEERFLHTEEVAGSKPASPTNYFHLIKFERSNDMEGNYAK